MLWSCCQTCKCRILFALARQCQKCKISLYWSLNNGLVESFNKRIRKALRSALIQNRNWRTEIYTFLLHYMATEHTTTEKIRLLSYFTAGRSKLNCLSSITKKRCLILEFATHCKSRESSITQTGKKRAIESIKLDKRFLFSKWGKAKCLPTGKTNLSGC